MHLLIVAKTVAKIFAKISAIFVFFRKQFSQNEVHDLPDFALHVVYFFAQFHAECWILYKM